MTAAWYRHDAAARVLILTVHVQPNARTSGVAGLHGDALRVRIAAPAVDDKANGALLDYLGRALNVPARALAIRHGARGRRKTIVIAGDDAALRAKVEGLAAT